MPVRRAGCRHLLRHADLVRYERSILVAAGSVAASDPSGSERFPSDSGAITCGSEPSERLRRNYATCRVAVRVLEHQSCDKESSTLSRLPVKDSGCRVWCGREDFTAHVPISQA